MDAHQRRVWSRMLQALDEFKGGRLDLEQLASQLKGCLGACDFHDQRMVDEFWNHFVEIDMELELRTEAWAPAGSGSDDPLRTALEKYRTWAEAVLATTGDERT